MNTLDAILTWRSCREFTDQPIEKEKLHQLLEAAMSGPSCVNAQDWSFVVVTDPEKLAQMADANGRPAEPLRKAAAGIHRKRLCLLITVFSTTYFFFCILQHPGLPDRTVTLPAIPSAVHDHRSQPRIQMPVLHFPLSAKEQQ